MIFDHMDFGTYMLKRRALENEAKRVPKAQLCPVCNGSGTKLNFTNGSSLPCHGCDGKGWVVVR